MVRNPPQYQALEGEGKGLVDEDLLRYQILELEGEGLLDEGSLLRYQAQEGVLLGDEDGNKGINLLPRKYLCIVVRGSLPQEDLEDEGEGVFLLEEVLHRCHLWAGANQPQYQAQEDADQPQCRAWDQRDEKEDADQPQCRAWDQRDEK